MVSFTVQLIIGGHRSIVCYIICKIMIVVSIVCKQRMLISDVFMETLLCKLCCYRPIQCRNFEILIILKEYNVTKKDHLALFENKAVVLKMYFIAFQTTYYNADTL